MTHCFSWRGCQARGVHARDFEVSPEGVCLVAPCLTLVQGGGGRCCTHTSLHQLPSHNEPRNSRCTAVVHVCAAMVVYGFRLDIAHVQGTQTVESYHWKLKGPHRGWELWSTRRLDYEFVTLTCTVADFFQRQLTQQCRGEGRLSACTVCACSTEHIPCACCQVPSATSATSTR
jgi:hypothetical protein